MSSCELIRCVGTNRGVVQRYRLDGIHGQVFQFIYIPEKGNIVKGKNASFIVVSVDEKSLFIQLLEIGAFRFLQ